MKKKSVLILILLCFGVAQTKAQFRQLYAFPSTNDMHPYGSLTLSGGVFYGMTINGGIKNAGNIFVIDTNGGNYQDILDFDSTNGSAPRGNVIVSGNTLYGMTYGGGAKNKGLIFSVNTDGSGFKDLLDFNGTNGKYPYGSLTLSGSNLYGMTDSGGTHNYGVVFSIQTDGTGYKILLNFNGSNGECPQGSLLLSGNRLYGMTTVGGAHIYMGCIFSIDTVGNNYKDLFDFSGYLDGSIPFGSLTLLGNKLYGMTASGAGGDGAIFSIDTNGVGYKDLVSLTGSSSTPYGSLTLFGNKFYGMTSLGGTYHIGSVFSIDTNGTGFSTVMSFNSTNGQTPYGDITVSGNKVCGMTYDGGKSNYGVIFSVDSNGSGYKDMHDFYGTNGASPNGSLTLSGNTFYGMADNGGGSDSGFIFCIDTNGKMFKTLKNLSAYTGAIPYGNLTLSGKVLYGMTSAGGTHDSGCIFSIDTDGSGYTNLFNFGGLYGGNPHGTLTLLGNKLYGMAQHGGTKNYGVIFSIDTDGKQYSVLYNFDNTTGAYPQSSLLLSGNKLYGMCYNGGTYNYGTIFSMDTNGSQFKLLKIFNSGHGGNPYGSLIISNSLLFGMTAEGSGGNVFSIDTGGKWYKDLYDFNGNYPYGDLTISGTSLYGMTTSGGVYFDGTVFTIDTNGQGFDVLINFNGVNGGYPYGNLTLLGNTFYGMTSLGAGYGNIFSLKTCTLAANANVTNNVSCYGGNSGSASSTASAGVPPYTYLWAPSGGSNQTASNLTAGTYTVSVKDNNGCVVSVSVKITQPTVLVISTTTTANVSCTGGNNGSISSSVTGGISPYTYLWSDANSQTTAAASSLTAGTYTINIKDIHGCTSTASATITQPAVLIVSTKATANVSCNRGSNGSATSNVIGGTLPYTYAWSNSKTTQNIAGLSAGAYIVTVNDSCGASTTASVTITQPNVLAPSSHIIANVSCSGGANGIDSVSISGGTAPYTYLWSDANSQTTVTASGLSSGTYSISIQDSNGCSATASSIITQPMVMITSHDSLPDALGCSGVAGVNISGGSSPYTYLWAPGGHTNDTINHLCAGIYACTVTDNNGCSLSTSITIVSCVNNYDEPICIITIDTANNKCQVVWGRTNSPPDGGYGYYKVYRDSALGYSFTHSQPLDSLSEYVDLLSDPSAGPVSYKLSTVDSCGESALSSPHTTMYLSTYAGVNVYILNWTAYVGFVTTKYRIFRGPSLNMMVQIDSVPNNVLTYHDTLPPLGSYYGVEAVSPNGPCTPSHRPNSLLGSFSNGFNTATLLGITSIENDIANLNIYPNPSNGLFTLSYSINQADNIQINIINELGQVVYEEQRHANTGSNTEQLHLESLASGIYSLRIQTNKGIMVRKLVKIY